MLLCRIVTEANVHDSVAFKAILKMMKGKLPRLKKIITDAGYMGNELVQITRHYTVFSKL
jgi:hypothetical protein